MPRIQGSAYRHPLRMIACAAAGLLAFACSEPPKSQRTNSEVARLVREFRQRLGKPIDEVQGIAERIATIGRTNGDRQVEARGLIRLAYLELVYGRWRNDWDKKLAECESICEGTWTVAEAELRMFRGTMRGRWLQRAEEGIEDIRQAIAIATQLRNDEILACAYARSVDLQLGAKHDVIAMEHAHRALAIAEAIGDRAILISALFRVVQASTASTGSRQAGLPYAERLVELGHANAFIHGFIDEQKSPAERETTLRKQLERCRSIEHDNRGKLPKTETAVTHRRLAQLQADRGDYREAIESARRAQKLYEELDNPTGVRDAIFAAATFQMQSGNSPIDVERLEQLADETLPGYLARDYSYLLASVGDLEGSRHWQSQAAAARSRQEQNSFEQSARSAKQFWQATLHARRMHARAVAAQQQTNDWKLALFLIGSATVIGLLAWRFREKNRMLERLCDEIARRKAQETENQSLQEQLIASQRLEAIGTFSTGVAHDFNNILTSIVGLTELVRDESEAHERERLANELLDSADLAAHTAHGLLTFARKTSTEMRPVDVAHIIRDTIDFLRRVLPASIEFECRLPNREAIWCEADQAKLKQVLLNLVLNARDAITGPGRICLNLSTSGQGERAVIEVIDDGRGIAEDDIEHVFDPFFSTKTSQEGTGLGLSIVKSIVTEHGGDIELHSRIGAGCAIKIVLPMTAPGNADETPQQVVRRGTGKNLTVILAEDDASVRPVLRYHLEADGFRVLECADGEAALRTYEKHRSEVSVVVLDRDLPIMDGESVLQRIRQQCANFPAVMISGVTANPTASPAVCLLKPFGSAELSNAILEVVNGTQIESNAG